MLPFPVSSPATVSQRLDIPEGLMNYPERSKIYRGYVKPRIIPNAIYNVIFV
jgi:hypothetical protein